MRRTLILLLLSLLAVSAFSFSSSDTTRHRVDSVFTISSGASVNTFERKEFLEEGVVNLTVTDSIQRYIDLAQALLKKVEAAQNYISSFDPNVKFELPVGIKKTVGGVSYNLIIEAIRLKPTHAELDVFLEFKLPQNGRSLTFMAHGVKLTKKGGIVGDAKLQLLGDNAINFNGDQIQLILKGGSGTTTGTYAVIDCDGFRELSLDAQVKFSRNLIRPENTDGRIIDGNVMAGFSMVVSDWNDMLVQFDLPAFQMTSLPDFGFKASGVVFDFSDTRNASSVVFPEGYNNTQMIAGNSNLWRGFYMRDLLIRMPAQFRKKSGAESEIRAQNMIIDSQGVSGLFSASNVIPVNEGSMNGWAFSLDSVAVKLMANELQKASFAGKIVIPVSNEKTPFDYTALITSDNEYIFQVSPASDLKFDLWAAKVNIYEGSSLEIKIANQKFLPKAILHGTMNISANLGGENGKGVELANVQFEDLELQSVKPFIKVGSFSFGSEALQQKLAQFPVSIQNIGLRSVTDTETALDFDLLLNLVEEKSGGFAADAGLSLITNITSENGIQKWKPKDIEVRSIVVDINGGAFKFNGSLNFYKKDIVYGNGFNGQVNAEFVPGIKMKCSAIFGNVDGNRYWYADAMAGFNSGIPIFTGVAIYGFGGGASYGMRIDNAATGSALGKTTSGVVYIPDTKAGLGIKAIVKIGSHPKPEAFNGDVTFEVAFFSGGGMRRIMMAGNAFLVTPGVELKLDELKKATNKLAAKVKQKNTQVSDKTGGMLIGETEGSDSLDEIFGNLAGAGDKGQVSAHASIDYDFENRTLHGNFEAFVNVAGGLIKGVGDGGRAGWAVLHFSPKEWYVYVGTPDDRIGLSVGIGKIRADATSYMMVGTKILDSPPPPENVSRILDEDLDYMRDLNALGSGAGFAFGAAFGVDTGDLKFMMFYARFAAGAGFDIMLKDYGDTHCKGESDRIGINGWYANGQAYAFVEGKIGIRVRVFGRRRNLKILEIGAATILQAKLPNPFWMRGIVGGHFSVLGGLVRGKCKFKMTLGKECEIEYDDNVLDDIKVISEITPGDGSAEVSVFNAPQGIFNMEVNKVFEVIDPEDNQTRYFQAKLDHFKILDGIREIPATLEWNSDHDVVALNPFDILPPTKNLKTSLQVSFEEKVDGTWRTVTDEGKVYKESQSTGFKTGAAPAYIPEENILFNYPVTNQLNFYTREYPEGYVQLKTGQPYLFEANSKFEQKVRYKGASGQESFGTLKYLATEKRVTFTIPDNLAPSTIYQVEMVSVPRQTYKVDQNVKEKIVSVGDEMEIKNKQAEGELEIAGEKVMYSTFFRTSRYANVREKINGLPITSTFSVMAVPWRVHKLMTFISGPEYFDELEITGTLRTQNKPLFQLEADLQQNNYYNKEVYPMVYAGYPLDGTIKVTWRDVNTLGLPPTKAMYIAQEPGDLQLTTTDIAAGAATVNASRSTYIFDLPYYMEKDFLEIQAQVVNKYIYQNTISSRVQAIMFNQYPPLEQGKYTYKLKYVLPGLNKVTTELNINTGF